MNNGSPQASVMRPIMPDGSVKFSRIPIANRFILIFRYNGQCYIAHIVAKQIVGLIELFPDFLTERIVPEGVARRMNFAEEIFSVSEFNLDTLIDNAMKEGGRK